MDTVNGKDLWDTYGVRLERGGAVELLALPDSKSRVVHDWEDEDGEEVLLTPTLTKARDVTLSCLIVAATGGEFWSAYTALYRELAGGVVALYVHDFDETYSLLLTGFGKPDKLTRIAGGHTAVKFSVKLRELSPGVKLWALADGFDEYPVDGYDNFLT
jgi:hypothetical protein